MPTTTRSSAAPAATATSSGTVPAPSGKLLMSVRKTAAEVDALARHQIVEIGDRRYLIWATVNVPGKGEMEVAASQAAWKDLKDRLTPILEEQFKDSQEQLDFRLDKDTVKIERGKDTVHLKEPRAREVAEAIRDFSASKFEIVDPSTISKKTASSSSASGKKPTSKSNAKNLRPPPRSENAADQFERIGEWLGSDAFIAGLQHVARYNNDTVDIGFATDREGQQVAWELNIPQPDQFNAGHGIGPDQLLRNFKVPSPRKKLLYIPIRVGAHFVGLCITPDNQVWYYDSRGHGVDHYRQLAEAVTAIRDQIRSEAQTVESDKPHQTDGIHCAAYQIHWFQRLCNIIRGTARGPHMAGPELMMQYRTQLAAQLRQASKEAFTASRQNHRSSEPSGRMDDKHSQRNIETPPADSNTENSQTATQAAGQPATTAQPPASQNSSYYVPTANDEAMMADIESEPENEPSPAASTTSASGSSAAAAAPAATATASATPSTATLNLSHTPPSVRSDLPPQQHFPGDLS